MNEYTYDMKQLYFTHINEVRTRGCIDATSHGDPYIYLQQIVKQNFKLKQDFVQMTMQTTIFC